jgi:hypothetical protein
MQCDDMDWNHFSHEKMMGVQYENWKSVSGSMFLDQLNDSFP